MLVLFVPGAENEIQNNRSDCCCDCGIEHIEHRVPDRILCSAGGMESVEQYIPEFFFGRRYVVALIGGTGKEITEILHKLPKTDDDKGKSATKKGRGTRLGCCLEFFLGFETGFEDVISGNYGKRSRKNVDQSIEPIDIVPDIQKVV